ncbi:MAG: 2-C-methyl-D-erythritol 4-phosphate cytidylyltransferase [Simkaniaceae bacterium]|nr:2-C-methyl-D-erythritol 4-phosphate cytidylyltransferase [Simkaniaceae bacterium]MCF7851645.1 2-C-methyl-D-erythritol 4-phosphate cytidylyltransferase [Simkaniaceae bacterium]
MTLSLILVAGGVGARFGGNLPKQYLNLADQPIALHSFKKFCQSDFIDEIIVVCEAEYESLFFHKDRVIRFAKPGESRQDSVASGCALAQSEYVAIHDASRPLVDIKRVEECFKEAIETKACALAVLLTSTVKQWDDNGIRTLDRETLWEVQTPQIIHKQLYLKASEYTNLHGLNFTDDLSMVEAYGHPTTLIEGHRENIKITYPIDLLIAENLLTQMAEYAEI